MMIYIYIYDIYFGGLNPHLYDPSPRTSKGTEPRWLLSQPDQLDNNFTLHFQTRQFLNANAG